MLNKHDFFRAFSAGQDNIKGSNVYVENGFLYNYSTPIAYRLENGNVILNKTKYSRTTSRNQYEIRYYCNVVAEVEYDEFMRLTKNFKN